MIEANSNASTVNLQLHGLKRILKKNVAEGLPQKNVTKHNMSLKKQLLESIRTSIAESNKRQKDEIDRLRDQHYEVLDYIDQNVKDEEFEANIHNFMLQTGAGPYGMLAAYVDKEKKLAKEKKPEKEAKAIPEETK